LKSLIQFRSIIRLLIGVAVVSICGADRSPAANPPADAQTADPAAIQDAQRVFALGRYKEAETILKSSLAKSPLQADLRYLLAYILLRDNEPKESLGEYTSAARLRPPSSEDLRNVALDYVLLNDYPDAAKWAQRSLQIDNSNPETWYTLGRVWYSTGKFQDAVACFRHTLALAPESVKAENNLGLAYEGLGQSDQAIQAYRTAIGFAGKLKRADEQPLINLAIILLHRSKLSEALDLLTRAAAIAPGDVRVHEQLGQLYSEQNQWASAQSQFEIAVSLAPEDYRLHFLLGRVYQREGMEEKARAEFSRSAALSGTRSTPPT
jgi:Flp pilus assembly protein TadD